MDFTGVDMNVLARQLRKPEGDFGKDVGKEMVEYNAGTIAFTFDCMHVQPTDRILEIGFGPGEAIAEAARLTPRGFVAGIDSSDVMLTMASERNHRALMQEQVELTLGSADDLPYGGNSFDKVFAVNVFHFWADPVKELSECMRVLKPEGKVFFYVTSPSSWIQGLEKTGVFFARESKDVEKILAQSGFQNVKSESFFSKDGEGFVTQGEKA